MMKSARENVLIFRSRAVLKRLLDEYENFDAARRLCADYCITADDIARLMDEISPSRRSKSRLTFAIRSDQVIDEAYLMAR
jgi:hypothetical protein